MVGTVSVDSRGFSVRSKRIHVVGGRAEYALLDPHVWSARLKSLKAAGFNTVLVSVPWDFHEPQPGHFEFDHDHNLDGFLSAAGDAGLWVILRIGPNVGAPFGGGGLPAWLVEHDESVESQARQREADPAFVSAVSTWWTSLSKHFVHHQPSDTADPCPENGPLLAVQVEHEWSCGNDEGAQAYLGELVHMIRELGVTVPLLTANGFWQELDGTIETWSDLVDEPKLFANTRQLHVVQPSAPRLVVIKGGAAKPAELASAMLKVIAAGGMPIVDDAVAGCHRRTTSPGQGSDGACASTMQGSIIGLDGQVVSGSGGATRIARFGRAFSHVLADLDPSLDSPVLTPDSEASVVIPRRGSGGEVVFFLDSSNPGEDEHKLVLRDGRALDVSALQPGGWCLIDVDLGGRGRLNYSNVPIFELLNSKVLIAYGKSGMRATIGIDGSDIELVVPEADAEYPLVQEHKGFVIVLCTERQADMIVDDGNSVFIGAAGLDSDSKPTLQNDVIGIVQIDSEGLFSSVDMQSVQRNKGPRESLSWSIAELLHDIDGSSDRFVTLNSPMSLDACGVRNGYGWYRVKYDSKESGKKSFYFPEGPHRLSVHQKGKCIGEIGPDSEASSNILDVKCDAGENLLTVLAERIGGAAYGNNQIRKAGLYDVIEVVERLKGARSTVREDVPPIDLFSVRSFIPNASYGDVSSTKAFVWTFTHRKKSSLRIDIGHVVSGTWLLNDTVLCRTEIGGSGSIRLNPSETECMKAGKNELIFRPDEGQEEDAAEMRSSLSIFEIVEEIGREPGALSFAICKIPDGMIHEFSHLNGTKRKKVTGVPSWNRTEVRTSGRGSLLLDVSKMTRGLAFIDGRELCGFDSSCMNELLIPEGSFTNGSTIDIFDVHGADPRTIDLVLAG